MFEDIPEVLDLPFKTVRWSIDQRLQRSVLSNRAINPHLLIMAKTGIHSSERWWKIAFVNLYAKETQINFDIPGDYELHFIVLYDSNNRVPDLRFISFDDRQIKLNYPLCFLFADIRRITVKDDYFGKSQWEQWKFRHPVLAEIPKKILRLLNS